MKEVLLFGILAVLVLIGFFIFYSSEKTPDKSTESITSTQKAQSTIDKRASFAIFTNGTFRIFTASMYHNLSPDVYIESSNPNIVKVKKADITWNDFFKTLPFKLTKDCLTTGTGQTLCTGESGELKFYLNGVLDQNALDQSINSDDQLLVTFGSETDAQIQKQLKQIPKAE